MAAQSVQILQILQLFQLSNMTKGAHYMFALDDHLNHYISGKVNSYHTET